MDTKKYVELTKWVLHVPRRGQRWSGIEKCACAPDGHGGSSPLLFDSELEAIKYSVREGLAHHVPVPVLLRFPVVGAPLYAKPIKRVPRKVRKTKPLGATTQCALPLIAGESGEDA